MAKTWMIFNGIVDGCSTKVETGSYRPDVSTGRRRLFFKNIRYFSRLITEKICANYSWNL
jgi:hypothetical protein